MSLGADTISAAVDAAVGGDTIWLSCHDADPGDSGAHEWRGGPYERQSARTVNRGGWRVQDSGARVTAIDGTLAYLGAWTAREGGSYIGGARTSVEDGNGRFAVGDTVIIPAGSWRIGVAAA